MLFIHVGLHKTGSSSIQRNMGSIAARHPELLKCYGPIERIRHIQPWTRKKIMREALSQNVFLSGESLLGDARDGYSQLERNVAELDSFTSGTPFQILVCLRPQTSWFFSLFSETFRNGPILDPSQLLNQCLRSKYFMWSNLLASLELRLGPTVRAKYLGPESDAVQFVAHEMGVGEQLVRIPDQNISPIPASLSHMYSLYKKIGFPPRAELAPLLVLLQQLKMKDQPGKRRTESLLSSRQYRLLEEHEENDRSIIGTRYPQIVQSAELTERSDHLNKRLLLSEELEQQLIQLALHLGPAPEKITRIPVRLKFRQGLANFLIQRQD